LLINKSRFFCFLVSIRTNIVQIMFYKSSYKETILKKSSKYEVNLTTKQRKWNFLINFLKVIHQLKKFL
jgi:hypothetical protein